MKEGGVYQVINRISGKRYVGSTVNLHKRWRAHRSALRRDKHSNIHLQRAWNLHGGKAFAFAMLEYVPDLERLVEREQYYIDTLQPEYNIAPMAGSNLGLRLTEETRLKLRVLAKGRVFSAEHKENIRRAKMGHTVSAEARAKMSEAHRGKVPSEETRQRLGVVQRGKVLSEEHRRKLSVARTGKGLGPLSEAHKQKISAALKGGTLSEEHKQKLREACTAEVKSRISAALTGIVRSGETRAKMSQAQKARTRAPFSEEHCRHLSEANKGKMRSAEQCQHISEAKRRENGSSAKLTRQEVCEIKRLLVASALRLREVAAMYGVSQGTISDIKSGRTWSYVSIEGEVKAA